MVVDSNYVLPSNRTMKGKAGVHLPQKGLIMLNADLMAENLGLSSENFFAMTLMHELVHAMTVKKINEYSSLSEEEKRIIDGLTALWKESKTKVKSIIDSMAFDAKRESLLTVYKMYLDSHPDNETASLKEFIAGVMTDPSLQDVLNGIRTKGGQSIWSKILSVLTDLISLINPDIKIDPDSVLANAVQNVLRLGKDIVPTEQVSEIKSTVGIVTNIYNQLGNNTQSENIVIKSWSELKDAKAPIYLKFDIDNIGNEEVEHIVSTRVHNSNVHFGNPFSNDEKVLANNPSLIKTSSTRESVEKYIDWVINSQDKRAKWIREQLQSGRLKGKPILYYKELGEPSHATALDYLINKYDWGITSVPVELKPEDYVLHSGGAIFSDSMWHIIGEIYGLKKF